MIKEKRKRDQVVRNKSHKKKKERKENDEVEGGTKE